MANPTVNIKQALGAAFVEVPTGNLTDETIAAVDNIQRDEVPANLVDVLHAIQTMSTHPSVRESASRNVLGEFAAAVLAISQDTSDSLSSRFLQGMGVSNSRILSSMSP